MLTEFIFLSISKDHAINIMNGSKFVDKRGVLYIYFLLYIKMRKSAYLTYYPRNRDVILNRAKDYYENDKERLREQARDKYRNLSEEEKNKKREYRKNRYLKMSEEKKERIKEYQKSYCEAKNSQYNNK